MNYNDLHEMLSSKFSTTLSWLASLAGFGSLLGLVNLTVALLSALWLIVQLWNYFTYTLPKNKREKLEWGAR